ALDVIRHRSKFRVDPTDLDDIKVTVDVVMEGIIKESFSNEDFMESDAIESVQKAVSESVTESIDQVIQQGQKEFNADVFEIWQQLETKHYNTWQEIKDDWESGENYYSNVSFDVNVTPKVYGTGTTN